MSDECQPLVRRGLLFRGRRARWYSDGSEFSLELDRVEAGAGSGPVARTQFEVAVARPERHDMQPILAADDDGAQRSLGVVVCHAQASVLEETQQCLFVAHSVAGGARQETAHATRRGGFFPVGSGSEALR